MNLNEALDTLHKAGFIVEAANKTEIDCSNWHWVKSMSSYNNNYYYDTLSNDEFYLEECDEDYGDYLYYACDKSGKKIKYLGYTNREGSVENCNGKLVLDTSMPTYRLRSDTLDIPKKYSDDVYNNIYAEFSNKEEFQRFYNENKEQIDDYTKFGWEMRYTAEFVAKTILDDLYLD